MVAIGNVVSDIDAIRQTSEFEQRRWPSVFRDDVRLSRTSVGPSLLRQMSVTEELFFFTVNACVCETKSCDSVYGYCHSPNDGIKRFTC